MPAAQPSTVSSFHRTRTRVRVHNQSRCRIVPILHKAIRNLLSSRHPLTSLSQDHLRRIPGPPTELDSSTKRNEARHARCRTNRTNSPEARCEAPPKRLLRCHVGQPCRNLQVNRSNWRVRGLSFWSDRLVPLKTSHFSIDDGGGEEISWRAVDQQLASAGGG